MRNVTQKIEPEVLGLGFGPELTQDRFLEQVDLGKGSDSRGLFLREPPKTLFFCGRQGCSGECTENPNFLMWREGTKWERMAGILATILRRQTL